MNTADLIAKCPKKVWIGTTEYEVSFVPAGFPRLKDEDTGEALNGFLHSDPPNVWIDEALPLTRLLEIIMHEFTHGVNDEWDIDDGIEEEEISKRHGKAWSTFWIHNPRFGRWWLSACVAVRKAQAGTPERKKRGSK